MEGSKTFSKDFMKKHNIPTAAYENFTDAAAAKAFVKAANFDVVLKASGLAAGKGVLIPTTKEEAYQGVDQILVDKVFGSAGKSNFLIIIIFFGYQTRDMCPKKESGEDRRMDSHSSKNAGISVFSLFLPVHYQRQQQACFFVSGIEFFVLFCSLGLDPSFLPPGHTLACHHCANYFAHTRLSSLREICYTTLTCLHCANYFPVGGVAIMDIKRIQRTLFVVDITGRLFMR